MMAQYINSDDNDKCEVGKSVHTRASGGKRFKKDEGLKVTDVKLERRTAQLNKNSCLKRKPISG